jgi:hypothetical protein
MSNQPKRTDALAQKRQPTVAGDVQEDASRFGRDTRPQGPANKFHVKKADARRKLPSGPLGGSGRKTNASRSS